MDNIPFSQHLASLAKGSVDATLTDDMRELVKSINDFRGSGELTIKLKFKPIVTTSGEVVMIDVQPEITLKKPKPKELSTRMFPTVDGELQRRDPNQPELPNISSVPTAPSQPPMRLDDEPE